jgi:hypothetical protein
VSDGRIQDVFWLFVREARPPLSGTTSFRAHVLIPPGKAAFLQKVRLDGDFGIADGQFEKSSTQATVNDFSERVVKSQRMDPTKTQQSLIFRAMWNFAMQLRPSAIFLSLCPALPPKCTGLTICKAAQSTSTAH